MRKYTQEELREIVRLHGLWLAGGRHGGVQANLSGSNLSGSNLSRSNLSGSNLSGSNLSWSNLSRSDLSWANLSGSNLSRSDLSGSNLSGSNLSGSNLSGSNLSGSDLRGTNLGGSNLGGSNLRGSDLRWSDLSGCRGLVLLTQTDHGHLVYASLRGEEWRIVAGCRDFSIAEARAHWGSPEYHTPTSGRRIIACLDWLERELREGNIR